MRRLTNQFKHTVADLMPIPARSICMGFAISLLALGAWSARATGTTIVTVTKTPDFQAGNLGGTGSFSLMAYSEQFQSLNPFSPPMGPNATKSITTVVGGTPGTHARCWTVH